MWEEAKKECRLALAAPALATEAAKCVNSALDEIDGLRSAQIKGQIERLSAEIAARASGEEPSCARVVRFGEAGARPPE
jgi:hypothetical protein